MGPKVKLISDIIDSLQTNKAIWPISADGGRLYIISPMSSRPQIPTEFNGQDVSWIAYIMKEHVKQQYCETQDAIVVNTSATLNDTISYMARKLYNDVLDSISNRAERSEWRDLFYYDSISRLCSRYPEECVTIYEAYHHKQINIDTVKFLMKQLHANMRKSKR